MGRGLSPMQRELLKIAISSREETPKDHVSFVQFRGACRHFFPEYDPSELNSAKSVLRGFEIFPSAIRSNRVQAAVSRSLRRLEERGLVKCYRRGDIPDVNAGFILTVDGVVEALLLVNSCKLT